MMVPDMKRDSNISSSVMREITPLSDSDCLYIADRHKSAFDYPIHCHPEYELNFIEYAAGARRTIGDHCELIGDYDLVLITGSDLEHVWEQGDCRSRNIREITIQFSPELLPASLLQRTPFDSIRRMIERAQCGLSFPLPAIMRVYGRLDVLVGCSSRFQAVMEFFEILHELSLSEGACELSSTSFARIDAKHESRRVAKVQEYIEHHYHEEIRLEALADLIGMTPVAFSRFFHQCTGRTLSEYISDIRIGKAARLLVDSADTVQGICYDCGFNTVSNFNRQFRKKKGCSPQEFREAFQKKKMLV